jgi:hypothetical protein
MNELSLLMPTVGSTFVDAGSGNTIERSGIDELNVKYNGGEGGGQPLSHTAVMKLSDSDFTRVVLSGKNVLYVGDTEKEVPFNGTLSLGGDTITVDDTLTFNHKLVMGGMGQGLKYSDFGVWAVNLSLDSPVSGLSGTYDGLDYTIAANWSGGQATRKSGWNANYSEAKFTGAAVAVASNGKFESGEAKSATVYGTAELTLKPSSANSSLSSSNKLVLDFVDFYKISFDNLTLYSATHDTSPGRFVATVGVTGLDIKNNGNTTGIELAEGHNTYNTRSISGQMYGYYPISPNEAVGNFALQDSGKEETVYGSFGVTR